MLSSKQKVAMALSIAVIVIALIFFLVGNTATLIQDDDIFTVRRQAVEFDINVVGELVPEARVLMTAPFTGEIAEIYVALGQSVRVGDPLLRLETSELDALLRNAEIELLNAQEKFSLLSNWEGSQDVSQARRRLVAAERGLKKLREETRETKSLYEQGIIPRSEYKSAEDVEKDQYAAVLDAKESLQSVLSAVNDKKMRIASLQLTNAQRSHEQLVRLRGSATVKASINGVVQLVATSTSSRTQNTELIVGKKMISGHPLYVVEQSDTLKIISYVNEFDIAKLSVGQIANVDIPSSSIESLQAHISSISGQATASDRSSAAPKVKVEAVLKPLLEDMSVALRVGSKVYMNFTTQAGDNIVLVPPRALSFSVDQAYVSIVLANGKVEPRMVDVGRSLNGSIEILSGIDNGDQIKLR